MSHIFERMARAAHLAAQERYPLLEPWDKLSPERRAYQRHCAAYALGALTRDDLTALMADGSSGAVLPPQPSEWVLAELQEAALNDDGSRRQALRRYRSLVATATAPRDDRSRDMGT
ncbi:hypothetical protein GCM10007301_08890 [Azorhizobium oxalatiphilum]|uniref:Uncharacterized protein n=1 Tax=Azorhizobium oxalatiphilum TaxID=980631 RepID=A0A917F7P7_9HYPH|nr:hypothetical protein [Azorhizobium oxalatiphilum]GGF51637.1 hypothetical protein GCM10007301_08890 [Azorhizobium oxalatiphilum]